MRKRRNLHVQFAWFFCESTFRTVHSIVQSSSSSAICFIYRRMSQGKKSNGKYMEKEINRQLKHALSLSLSLSPSLLFCAFAFSFFRLLVRLLPYSVTCRKPLNVTIDSIIFFSLKSPKQKWLHTASLIPDERNSFTNEIVYSSVRMAWLTNTLQANNNNNGHWQQIYWPNKILYSGVWRKKSNNKYFA